MQPSKITSIANFLNINTLSTQGTGSLFVVGTALCIVGCLKASPPPQMRQPETSLEVAQWALWAESPPPLAEKYWSTIFNRLRIACAVTGKKTRNVTFRQKGSCLCKQ